MNIPKSNLLYGTDDGTFGCLRTLSEFIEDLRYQLRGKYVEIVYNEYNGTKMIHIKRGKNSRIFDITMVSRYDRAKLIQAISDMSDNPDYIVHISNLRIYVQI